MITYAQNFEDVILARVFHARSDGFYVDVGAGDPVNMSVTKWFYDMGWSGINVEPNRALFKRLVAERPRDINLNCGAGRSCKDAQFLETAVAEFSSFDPRVLSGTETDTTARTVSVLPLTEILDQHGGGRTIDFLKIDVEGWEHEVLAGLDLRRYRPTVIVVEATIPQTRVESHSEWESDLLGAKYSFVYFDGLNRFYLANENIQLKRHFALPPNVFDDFKNFREASCESDVERLTGILQLKESEIARLANLTGAKDAGVERLTLAERLDRIEPRLAGLERTANSIHELVQTRRRQRRLWRDKFRPRLWHYQQYPPQVLRVPSRYAAQIVPENTPRIAIITPSYNSAKFLRATIDSVLAQNYPNLAYIIEDGASTDGTVQLLKSYGDRIVWRSEPDSGQASAINRGFARVEGEIMGYLNSDDVLLPGALAYVAQAFVAKRKVDIVYGHRIFIDADGSEIGRWVLPPHDARTLKWADYIPQETMFWRRRVWDKVGPLDESFHYALDWDFALRAQAAGFRFRRLPRFLGCFRVHDQQKSTAMMEVGTREQGLLRQAHLGYEPDGGEIHRAIRGYLRRHVLFHGLYRWGVLKY